MGDFHPDSTVRVAQVTLSPAAEEVTDLETGDVLIPAHALQLTIEYVIVLPSGTTLNRTALISIEHEWLHTPTSTLEALFSDLQEFIEIHEGRKEAPPAQPLEAEAAPLVDEPEAEIQLSAKGTENLARIIETPTVDKAGPTYVERMKAKAFAAPSRKPAKKPRPRRGTGVEQ